MINRRNLEPGSSFSLILTLKTWNNSFIFALCLRRTTSYVILGKFVWILAKQKGSCCQHILEWLFLRIKDNVFEISWYKTWHIVGTQHPRLPWWLISKESACSAGDIGLIPRLGRSPREGNGSPLQYSCLGNSMDRQAWWATVHGITESQARLNDYYLHFVNMYCLN